MEGFDCIPALKALGEETRMQIVGILLRKECSVNELAEELSLTDYNVSKHLRVLNHAGIVDFEKHGNSRVYHIVEAFHSRLSNLVLDLGCCKFDFNQLSEES